MIPQLSLGEGGAGGQGPRVVPERTAALREVSRPETPATSGSQCTGRDPPQTKRQASAEQPEPHLSPAPSAETPDRL